MIKTLTVVITALALSGAPTPIRATAAGPADGGYAVLGHVSGPDGSFDYVSVDVATGDAYVGRDFGVQVLRRGKLTTLLRRKGVASVLPIGPRSMLSTNFDSNSATLFDRRTGAVFADIATGNGPDGAAFDPASGLAFVMDGESKDITAVDIAGRRAVARIPVGGAPEGAVADGKGHLFLNVEDHDTIAVIDIARRKVITTYALPGCHEPTGIAYDPRSGLLISACRNGMAKLVEATGGRDRGSIAIGQGADGSLFESRRGLGFIPCIDGSLTIYRLAADGRVAVLQRLFTRDGARTAAYDSKRDRLYLASARIERDRQGQYVRAVRNFRLVLVGRR